MKKLLGICGIIGAFFLSACKEEKFSLEGLDNRYLPLAIGNYWIMDDTDNIYIQTITETKVLDQKTYYAIKTKYDTSYIRNENDKIVEYYKGKTSVKFDLTANVNDTWKYRDYTATLTSKTDTITIGGQEIKNCYRFYYDIPASIDEEHAIWLAPGIGFIQEECYGECVGGKRKLKEMKIDGKVYNL
jgi:hypothetical protein